MLTKTGPKTLEAHPAPVINPIQTPCGRGPRTLLNIVCIKVTPMGYPTLVKLYPIINCSTVNCGVYLHHS